MTQYEPKGAQILQYALQQYSPCAHVAYPHLILSIVGSQTDTVHPGHCMPLNGKVVFFVTHCSPTGQMQGFGYWHIGVGHIGCGVYIGGGGGFASCGYVYHDNKRALSPHESSMINKNTTKNIGFMFQWFMIFVIMTKGNLDVKYRCSSLNTSNEKLH